VPVSLSQAIADAKGALVRFTAIGMDRAYTGAPAEATRDEGEATYERLVEMIVTEVREHLGGSTGPARAADVVPRHKEEKQR
jgi:creatinine amidohydrolase